MTLAWLTTWPVDNAMLFSLMILAVLVTLVVILHRTLHERWATVAGAILIPVAITLVLNHVLAAARDRDGRRWVLRQEHLRRLQPVLRMDADKLREVAGRTGSSGRVSSIFADGDANENEFRAAFFPDVMSGDLGNHFGSYVQEKDRLRADAQAQEQDFKEAVSSIARKLPLSQNAGNFGPRGVALAVIEKCMERGPGMVVNFSPGTLSYSVPGASGSGTGGYQSIPPDMEAGFRAFNAFRPDPATAELCTTLKTRAARIVQNANKLSAEARTLAERTVLSGDCEYTRLD